MFSITCREAPSIWGHFVGRAMITPDVECKMEVALRTHSMQQAGQLVILTDVRASHPGAGSVPQSPAVPPGFRTPKAREAAPGDNTRVTL